MMRRSHKKSRNGCLECKKRHIKCDETRPQCINCTTVQRECRYSTPWAGAERSPSHRSASPQVSPPGHDLTPTALPAAFPGLHPLATGEEPHSSVDMVHMELLHHYLTDPVLHIAPSSSLREVMMANGLREPYVMHSLLALSAHHLSVIRPGQEVFYRTLATQLQTRALSLFNSIDVSLLGDSAEKRVPVFVFSSVLGFHALCDSLTYRDPDFDSAFARFMGYLRIHRGLHSVMHGYWDELRKTELKHIFNEIVPRWYHFDNVEGRECDEIRERIRSLGLDAEEAEATQKAIDLIQSVFDAKPRPEDRAYVLCTWAAMLQRPFVRMLEAARPEALAVLAYFFLAMHHCRSAWMIGGAGQHLLTLLANHFRGGEWYAWVETPYRVLQDLLIQLAPAPSPPAIDESCTVPMARDFVITRPHEADAPRIAEIHLAAMDSNPLLHAQFPTPESLESLQQFLRAYTAEQLQNAASGVFVARDPDTGLIAGFMKWDSPSHPEDVKLESGDLRYLEGCRREFLDGYAALATEAKSRCFGDEPCYRLNFVCTDPGYQGEGAGSLLTRKVLEMAAADGLPVYLESTEVAVQLYTKLGFQVLDGFEMSIPRAGSAELSEVYRELCMVWRPPSK
ncbi:acyl-CoA N-acyltransferase [Achaetomium macrosporum]|uniref:Acyl-CoA N-acyltransferase n=1 Tax=Achaetomium macrosporum TaxID=79813 RepID=A0AAN7CGR9_9PEZI|nr:acyl-CoA N-acyltransferase [Achaetomium macrosporum]